MNFERRRQSGAPESIPAKLPIDFLRMVEETIEDALSEGLDYVKQKNPNAKFHADGSIYDNEVLLLVSLSLGGKALSATTVYGSADFNPALPKPTTEDILSACLDSIGSVFAHYMDPKVPERLEALLDAPLSSLEEAPFDWGQVIDDDDDVIPVWVKMDKTNPKIESLTDQWLRENDPQYGSKDDLEESAEFLAERLEAIKNAKTGTGTSNPGGSGPITH